MGRVRARTSAHSGLGRSHPRSYDICLHCRRLAIISGVLDILAARLLGAMLLVFSALALAPLIFATARDHISWGANAYSQTAVGAVWNIADAQSKQNHPCGQPPEYGLLRKRYRIGGELI